MSIAQIGDYFAPSVMSCLIILLANGGYRAPHVVKLHHVLALPFRGHSLTSRHCDCEFASTLGSPPRSVANVIPTRLYIPSTCAGSLGQFSSGFRSLSWYYPQGSALLPARKTCAAAGIRDCEGYSRTSSCLSGVSPRDDPASRLESFFSRVRDDPTLDDAQSGRTSLNFKW